MKLRLCLKNSYSQLKILKSQVLAFYRDLIFLPLINSKKLLVDKGKLAQLRQVMIISDIVKMREKLHVLKNS